MSERVVVPEGMLDAAYAATKGITTGQSVVVRDGLEAALRWLRAENVRDPYGLQEAFAEWQSRMFRAPEPDVPEAVDPVEFLFAELLDLTETLLPHEADKLGHIRQELERHRRGLRGK